MWFSCAMAIGVSWLQNEQAAHRYDAICFGSGSFTAVEKRSFLDVMVRRWRTRG